MKRLSKEEREELAYKVEAEGFGYYMLCYGPDLDAIERMGFDRKEVEAAISLFSTIENAIMSAIEE